MKHFSFIISLILASNFFTYAYAQEIMTLDKCMAYAVENSTKARKQEIANDNYRQQRNAALASFFPTAGGTVSGSADYGLSAGADGIKVSTPKYYNGYSLSSDMPLFAGLSVINTYRATRAAMLMGCEELRRVEDETALEVMQAYFDYVYYDKAAEFARQQLEASRINLAKSVKLEELGLQSRADVIELEAQMASDDYLLTQQENNRDLALILLAERMNWPSGEPLEIDTDIRIEPTAISVDIEEVVELASGNNPSVMAAAFALRQSELQYAAARGTLLPSVYLGAGYGTSYYKITTAAHNDSFRTQLRDNRNYYVGATLSIPIFNGLNRRTTANRYRNAMLAAEQNKIAAERALHSEIEQNYRQMQGYGKEYLQATKKVEAATLAHKAAVQKYSQGLVSAFELQSSAGRLLEAQSQQLNARLQYIIKCRLMDYYRGEPLIR